MQINEQMVFLLQTMEIGMGVFAPALKVLPADQTGVHVQIGQCDRAQLLEVEIQTVLADGPQVRTVLSGTDWLLAAGSLSLVLPREIREGAAGGARQRGFYFLFLGWGTSLLHNILLLF
jgi:hypothetical protein